MRLEKTLAGIQVLGESLDRRAINSNVLKYLRGAIHEAETVSSSRREALKAMRSQDDSKANRYVGDFAIAVKNLADNLNLFIQTVSGYEHPRTRNISRLEDDVIRTEEDITIYELFTKVHNHNKMENSLIRLRNDKAHGNGHILSKKDESYEFEGNDVKRWLDETSKYYLDMTREIFHVINKGDHVNFHGSNDVHSITTRRITNYVKDNTQKTLLGILTLLISGGAIGSAADNYFKMKTAMEKSSKAAYVLWYNSGVSPYVDNFQQSLAKEYEEELLDEMISNSIRYLGRNSVDKNDPRTWKYFSKEEIDSILNKVYVNDAKSKK